MPDSPHPKKVLIVRVGAMGDVLHALAGVSALRRSRPEWQIDWVVDERWVALLWTDEHRPIVDHALPFPIRAWKRFPRSAEVLRSIRQLYRLRCVQYDFVVDMQGTLRSAIMGRLAGGRRLVGYADPRESVAALLYERRILRRGTHVVDQGAALLGEACGVSLPPAYPELPLDLTAESWADDFLADLGDRKRLALLAPAAGWPAKQWAASHFAALAEELARRGWTVLVNNPGTHDPAAQQVLASASAARGVHCGIAEFTSLLRRTSLVIGGDSGPIHLAAALGVPLVALFGPTDPARNGPWGPGPKRVLRHPASTTSYRHVATPDAGLAQLTVGDVLAGVDALPFDRGPV